MKAYFVLLFFVFLGFTSIGQTIKFDELEKYQDSKLKFETYITSTGDSFSIGDNLYFINYKYSPGRAPFLLEKIGNKPVHYAKMDAFNFRIYKFKLSEKGDESKVTTIIYDERTMLKFKLDIEAAIQANQLYIGKEERPNVETTSTESEVTKEPVATNNEGTVYKKVIVVQGQDTVFQEVRPTYSLVSIQQETSQDMIAKEMMQQSALCMKKFTRGYNRSLLLTGGGIVLAGVIAPDVNSQSQRNPIAILGAIMIIGGGIQGVAARQHIGRAGAYLEASANGVRIRF